VRGMEGHVSIISTPLLYDCDIWKTLLMGLGEYDETWRGLGLGWSKEEKLTGRSLDPSPLLPLD
jgi:hypothetical protein